MTTGIEERVPSTAKGGILIGIASSGRACPIDWARAMATQVYPPYTNTGWAHVVHASIDDARNAIVDAALATNLKYLWFVDDDTEPPVDAARKLMYVLDQEGPPYGNVMAVGGIYCVKQDPPVPLVFRGLGAGPFWGWKKGDVFDCDAIGTGCLMINLDVFRQLEAPWFKTTVEEGLAETDDVYFCRHVKAAGFRILAHGGVLCRHWDLSDPKRAVVYSMPLDSAPMRTA